MDNSLIFNRIRITGKKKADYTFETGLNILLGSNSTGKSTILSFIDFVLGSGKKSFIVEVKNYCDFVYCEITINNKPFTVKRGIKENQEEIDIYEGHFENLSELANKKYRKFGSSKGNKEKERVPINEFFLEELSIPSRKVLMTKTTGSIGTISWRNLMNLIFINQNGWDEIQSKNFSGQPLMKKAVFESFFDLVEVEMSQLNMYKSEEEINIESLETQIGFLKNIIDDSKRDFGSDDNVLELKRKIGNLENKKTSIFRDMQLKDESKKLQFQSTEMEEKIKEMQDKIDQSGSRQKELEMLYNENDLNIEKNRLLLKAGKIFSEIPITKCPKCLNVLEDKNSDCQCYICGKNYQVHDQQREYSKNLFLLVDEKREIEELKLNIFGEMKDLTKLKESALKEKLNIDNKINDLNKEIVSPLLKEIEIINNNISLLNKQLGEAEQINPLLKQESNLIQEKETKEKEIGSAVKRLNQLKSEKTNSEEIKKKFKGLFEDILKNVLSFSAKISKFDDCYIPLLEDETIFDRKNIEDGLKRSKTLKVVLAYYTAVLEYSLIYGSFFPKILILDTPRQDELDETIFEKLFIFEIAFFRSRFKKVLFLLAISLIEIKFLETFPSILNGPTARSNLGQYKYDYIHLGYLLPRPIHFLQDPH